MSVKNYIFFHCPLRRNTGKKGRERTVSHRRRWKYAFATLQDIRCRNGQSKNSPLCLYKNTSIRSTTVQYCPLLVYSYWKHFANTLIILIAELGYFCIHIPYVYDDRLCQAISGSFSLKILLKQFFRMLYTITPRWNLYFVKCLVCRRLRVNSPEGVLFCRM